MPYIEKDFPIEPIDEIAWSESSSRKPIYLLHKWFARRVGSTFRALILGCFLDDNPMKYYYTKIQLKNAEGKPPIVLDPFMGGGTTIVEGHRLGCKMIGVDINPLAWYITKKELQLVDKKRVKEEFKRIEKAVKDKILSYYKTKCKNGHDADVMYVFWAKKIKCENCQRDVPLYKSFIIAKLKKSWIYQCPKCGEIFHDNKNLSTVQCPTCAERFDPNNGFTTGKTYKCPHCRFEGDILKALQRNTYPPEHTMFAIEYYCPTCGRDYKKPGKDDIELYLKAKREFEQKKEELLGKLIPDQQIPDGFNTKQMKNFNYNYWYQMFNERQLICLSMILNEILKIKDENTREFFLIVFSNSLNANNMFTIYNITALKIEPLFGGHHFWPPNSPIEGNVWGIKYGRGTFSKYYEKALKSIEYQEKPYEIMFKDKRGKYGQNERERLKKVIENDIINGRFASSFKELLAQDKNVLLICDTAENLGFIPNESVDAIVTDPPYYDNIMYSELSDFFYVWLRLGLKERYPDVFGPPFSRKDREILVNKTQGKGEEFYIEGLARVFREAYRVLKENGIMAFVFQHKKTEAWSAVLKALLRSGFYVLAVYPTHGETPSGMRAYGINYNSILVCKKLTQRTNQQIPWIIFESELRSKVDAEIDKILDKHPDLEVEDAFIIAMGKALEVYSQNYGNIVRDGEIFDVSNVSMEIIGDIVFDSLLRHILERVPNVDRLSKIYASVFAKRQKITNDTLNKLTRHGGIETTAFEDEKLVKKDKKKGIMTITPPNEREDHIRRKIQRGIPLTYIDAAHLLWITREEDGDFNKTLEILLRNGIERKTLEQYVDFLAERTNIIMWKKIQNMFRSAGIRTLEDFSRKEEI